MTEISYTFQPSLLIDQPTLILSRQPSRPGRALRFPIRGLPDGRRGQEGLPPRLLRDEPLHRLDPAHGQLSGVAALRGQVPPGAGRRARDHHLSGLHPRNLPAGAPGHLRVVSSGQFIWMNLFDLFCRKILKVMIKGKVCHWCRYSQKG